MELQDSYKTGVIVLVILGELYQIKNEIVFLKGFSINNHQLHVLCQKAEPNKYSRLENYYSYFVIP